MGPEGPAGPAGTARAYATIDPASCTGSACIASKSKEIGNVTRVSTGHYCISAFGMSSEFLPGFVTVEHSTTASPQTSAFAYVSASAPECTEGQFLVVTKRGSDAVSNTVGFSILIP
jgi:hypothetical protein